jgi:hypothetical protein
MQKLKNEKKKKIHLWCSLTWCPNYNLNMGGEALYQHGKQG